MSTAGRRELSFAQQRFWLLEQIQPGAASANVVARWRLRGPLVRDALVGALQRIVARHEILRTCFPDEGGRPVAVVGDESPALLRLVDLSALGADEREVESGWLAEEEASRAFDLGGGPLLRALLLRLGPADHVLLLALHHIVCDAWSMGVLRRELAEWYASLSTGRPVAPPPLPAQYADHAAAQRSRAAGGVLAPQLERTRRRLAGAPRALELPCDRARPPLPSRRARRLAFDVPHDVESGLRDLARRERATLFMTLASVFCLLLARHTGQEDVVFASPVSTRPRRFDGVIGPFLNTLVLRADLSGEPTFRALLARVRGMALAAYRDRDLPFEQLVAALHPERDVSRHPLAQVIFQLLDTRGDALELAGLRAEGLGGARETVTPFDLELHVHESVRGLWGCVVYSADLFDEESIERLTGHYRGLLASVVERPDTGIWDLEWLPPAERRLMAGWDHAAARPPADRGAHELVEAQARRTPRAVAVQLDGQALTYEELSARSAHIAGRLRELGVGPEVLVGVCLERSPDLVAALLGVLRAGGAYVPLDPEHPPERLADAVRDAGCRVLVSQASLVPSLPATPAHVLALDLLPAVQGTEEPGPASIQPGPESTAYVIYTSGSTGRPKGVRVPHRALVNFLLSMRERPGLGPRDSLLAVTTVAFDIAALELLLPLVCGARAVLVGREIARDGALLAAALERSGATVMQATPATWQMLLASGWTGRGGLRALCGGEALTLALATALQERCDSLWNLYGPTETTVWSTVARVAGAAERITIGRPIANTVVHVLDHRLQPVPIGAVGELCIGGAGLAHGYHGRPALTAERFVPSPGGPPGGRLYRTGDLGRRLPSGTIEHLGRMDHQVKVRGFRVELGEIEARLVEHPAVREAVVAQREDSPGQRRLVAYVAGAGQLTAGELRAHLRARLPDHMLPARFVQLDRLPRTASGKADRRGLPAPEAGRPQLDAAYTAPRTPVEARVAKVWSDLLGLHGVGVDDDFFQLGGDSLQAVQLAVRLSSELDVVVPALTIYRHPTVAALAGLVAGGSLARRPPAEPASTTGTTELLPGQNWVFQRMRPEQCCMTAMFEVPAGVDRGIVARAFDAVLGHHDALRARFVRTPGGWRQVIPEAGGPSLAVGFVDLSGLAPDAQRVELESRAVALQHGIDFERGPQLRVVHFSLGRSRPGRLLVLISHLVADAYSAALVHADVETAHRQLSAGLPVSLPPKTTSIKEYTDEVAAFARSEAGASEARYWLDLPWASITPLPVDLAAGPGGNTYASQLQETVALDEAETARLLRDVPRLTGAEVSDVLVGALAQTVAAWAGSTVVDVCVVAHRRNVAFDTSADLSRTVGFVGHGHPELLAVDRLDTPAAALEAIARQRRAVPRRGLGFEVLRDLGRPDVRRRLGALPVHQIVLNYLGDQSRPVAAGGPAPTLFLRPAPERVRPVWHPEIDRTVLLEYQAVVLGGRFRMDVRYSGNRHLPATVRGLADGYASWLRRLLEECGS